MKTYLQVSQAGMYVTSGRLAEPVTGNDGKSAFLVTYGCYGKKTGMKIKHPRVFQSNHDKLTKNKKKSQKIYIKMRVRVYTRLCSMSTMAKYQVIQCTNHSHGTYYSYGIMPTYHTNQLIPTAAMGKADSSIPIFVDCPKKSDLRYKAKTSLKQSIYVCIIRIIYIYMTINMST